MFCASIITKVRSETVDLRKGSIEKELGEKTDGEVICVEDIVEELQNVGNQFSHVQKFLWPFQLASVRSKFQKQKLNFKDGGDYGDRGEEMDDFIRQVL